MKPSLGSFTNGHAAAIDVPRLLETRMLIQAGSGFGKSYACRRLLEQTAGHVQQLIVDPDGEFASLREKHDYVIAAAQGGDAVAHPRSAALLARRLLETGVSAILDIYELKAHERAGFVRHFFDALVNAPKSLWQPVMVLLDEAHVFCPEGEKSEAAGAVIDLATRGRKRGFGLVLATQRLSKLNKDAAAEAFNKLIGRCQLDVDVRRAAAELGMTPKDALAQFQTFEPGDFFAFGPALSPAIARIKVGEVKTTHPKAGQRGLRAPPAPTAAIKAMLPKLADLPKEAEQELRTVEDLRRELATARRELTQARKSAPAPAASNEQLQAAEQRGFAQARAAATKDHIAHLKILKGVIHQAVEQAFGSGHFTPVKTPVSAGAKPAARTVQPQISRSNGAGESLPKGERAVLGACLQFPDGLKREQITVLTGYKRSTRDAYIQRLAEKAYLEVGALVLATDAGRGALPDFEPLPTGPDLQTYWFNRLPEGEGKILRALVERHPDPVQRDELTELTGYKRSTRDAYLQRLTAKQLVAETSRGQVAASETLF